MNAAKKERLNVVFDELEVVTAKLANENEAVNALLGFAAKITAGATSIPQLPEQREKFVRLAGQWFDMAADAERKGATP